MKCKFRQLRAFCSAAMKCSHFIFYPDTLILGAYERKFDEVFYEYWQQNRTITDELRNVAKILKQSHLKLEDLPDCLSVSFHFNIKYLTGFGCQFLLCLFVCVHFYILISFTWLLLSIYMSVSIQLVLILSSNFSQKNVSFAEHSHFPR